MNKYLYISVVVVLTLFECEAAAQSLIDSSDVQARRIFDVPGTSSLDPDETLEYLDELSTLTGDTLERLHANADISWHQAHEALRTHHTASILRNDSSAGFNLRSRVSSPIDADAQEGYTSGQYLGGPEALYNRIRARSSEIEVSALEQKYSWEPSFTDRLTGFAELRNPIPIDGPFSLEKAVVGDYALAFGNGLLFGGGLASSKGIHPAYALEERSFGLRGTVNGTMKDLRGGAIELSAGPSNLFAFASDRSFDAAVENGTIDSIYSTSYHQTENELAKENAASAEVLGARVEIATPDTANLYIKAGATAYKLNYDDPYVGTSTSPFIGSQLSMAGVDALAMSGVWTALGEIAHSVNDTSHQTAMLFTTIFTASKDVAFSMLYRHIPYRFISPFGELSGLSPSLLSDLDGFYAGIETSPIPGKLKLNAYAEFESELVPIGDLFAKQEYDYLADASYRATDALDLKATVRDQENPSLVSDTTQTYVILPGQTLNIRLEAGYHPEGNATFRTRYEHVYTSPTTADTGLPKNGWQASEEVKIKMPAIQSELTITTTRFQTAASFYNYEEGSPGTAAFNSLNGLGWRVTVRATVHTSQAFACSAYLAGTVYDAEHSFGYGTTGYIGTSNFNATVQIDVKL